MQCLKDGRRAGELPPLSGGRFVVDETTQAASQKQSCVASFIGDGKASMLGQSSGVARAMQDANDHKLALVMHVIDCAIARETDA
jgi:hypothetical protein